LIDKTNVVKRRLTCGAVIARRNPRKIDAAAALRSNLKRTNRSGRGGVVFICRLQRFENVEATAAQRLSLKRRDTVAVECQKRPQLVHG
jgi:hypothetical protein